MTFDKQVSATLGQALADLRDNIGGMTNWTVEYDSSGGSTDLSGGKFAVSSPSPTEYFEIDHSGSISLTHGTSYDGTNGAWNSQYSNDPGSIGSFSANSGDAGSYWMEYVPRGFGFYWQREVGDGDDEDIFIGVCQVNKAWDYSQAEALESEWVCGYGESAGPTWEPIHLSESGVQNDNLGNNNYSARGQVNPDNNYDNFPLTNNIVSSSQYRSANGEDTVVGDFNLWVGDISGSSTGHKDLIQNDSGTDVYTVLKRQGKPALLLRMD